jgi:hypothetical protein
LGQIQVADAPVALQHAQQAAVDVVQVHGVRQEALSMNFCSANAANVRRTSGRIPDTPDI